MRSLLLVWALLSLQAILSAASSADEVLAKARTAAVAEKKVIFLKFDSPGCGWCKILEGFLDSPEVRPVFQRHFVTASLRVPDIAGNPGALKFLDRNGGLNHGVPFFAFLDTKGALIVNSLREGKVNIGYPEKEDEIQWFISMIRKADPSISTDETALIEKQLRSFRK